MLKLRRRRQLDSGGLPEDHPAAESIRVRVPRPRWRWVSLFVSHLMAGALLASWWWPASRRIWDLYDAGVFRALNATLSLGDAWVTAVAFANTRAFDWVAAAAVGVLLLWNIRFYEVRCRLSGWFSLGLLVCVVCVTKFCCGPVIHELVGFQRASPTSIAPTCYRVTEMVPSIDAKDSSPCCFPSDHGFVLFSVALYLVYRGSTRQEMLAWLCVVLFGTPRIFAGAHWATDVVVGSAAMALVLTAWLMATPLHDRLVNRA